MKLAQNVFALAIGFAAMTKASVLLHEREGKSAADNQSQPTATIYNFAPKDIIGQYDGLEPHPYAPLRYGKPVRKLDKNGNAVVEHAASLNYFNGTYYMYSESWACGRITFFSGSQSFGMPAFPSYNTSDTGSGRCGLPIYSSPNLVDWELAGFFTVNRPEEIPQTSFGPNKMKARFLPNLNKYIVWFNAGNGRTFNLQRTGSFYYAIADTPYGPWSEPQLINGDHLAHDYDIADGPDGSVYVVTDVYSGYDDQNAVPLWDVYVQKINEDMTGTVGTNNTTSLIMNKAHWEGIGFFYNLGWWYITGGPTCANCEVPIWYAKSRDPFGPYYTASGRKVSEVREGTVLSENGCGAQNKGANVLPTANGGQVVLTGAWGYRTDPQDFSLEGHVSHGSNAQAISSTYWFPQNFDNDGNLQPFTCAAEVVIPLADPDSMSVTQRGPYQPDCRINFRGGLRQTLSSGLGGAILNLTLFQLTWNLGPVSQAGNVMNGPLNITLSYTNGNYQSVLLDPKSSISWDSEVVSLRLNGSLSSITMTSNATNGCFGTMAQPKSNIGSDYEYFTDLGVETSVNGQIVMNIA
ncbi:hypothetical protein COCC4DRAFT_45826 [Bipolaris maydis ATCC 48331]|nr:uncharacterized protein COCC4DRAFT_45826 [Bipolaris maydis ATCC 48331]ENH98734.1 hypothetical protein COCC4DRAFT_45826 [Bipolaris maydis ATCC 48331]KAJ5021530.1 glycosyl hydrolase [Bipolaris maydis]KAJ6265629.1 glycosyl hydrolase [Bipolaris maydis]KAJ6277000.1 glycosyl hydrolase [Bipolaris maydis]